MAKRQLYLFIFLGIAGILATYLTYVSGVKKQSVQLYVMDPKLGDVYKMRQDDREQGVVVRYYKIKDIGKEAVYFNPESDHSSGLHDNFRKHFDTSETVVFSRRELIEIRDGLWNTNRKNHTTLLEIERK